MPVPTAAPFLSRVLFPPSAEHASARPPEHVPVRQRRHRSLHAATAPPPAAAPGSPPAAHFRRAGRASPRPSGLTASARGAAGAPQRRGSGRPLGARAAVGRASDGWQARVGWRAGGGRAPCRGALRRAAAPAPGPLALSQAVALPSLAERVRPELAAASALSPRAGRELTVRFGARLQALGGTFPVPRLSLRVSVGSKLPNPGNAAETLGPVSRRAGGGCPGPASDRAASATL